MNEQTDNMFLAYMILNHDRQDLTRDRLNLLNPGLHDNMPIHPIWQDCDCLGAKHIAELVEVEIMDEDSPNNMLSNEEHIALFNKFVKKDQNTPTKDIIATRNAMKLGIAKLRTAVQAKTVILNDRRKSASREEKEAIVKADKQYSPALRPEEKASDKEIKTMHAINERPKLKAFLKMLPTAQYKAFISLINQLGIEDALNMFPMFKNEVPVSSPDIAEVGPESEEGTDESEA
jgi:hypothetical protein